MIIFIIAAMVIALLAVIFALQNTATVTVAFLVWTVPGSQALVLLVALFAGIAICFLAFLPSWVRHRWTIRQLRKRVTLLETSLSDQERATNEAKQKLWDQTHGAAQPAAQAAATDGAPRQDALQGRINAAPPEVKSQPQELRPPSTPSKAAGD